MSMNGRYDIKAEITFEHEDPERALIMALYFTHGELHFSPHSYHGWDIRLSADHNRMLLPSGAILADFAFLSPHYQLGEVAVGRKFWIKRGSQHQGTGYVTRILNLEQSARKSAHYDLPVEVTFLQPPINNPSRFYSLFYGKHLNSYDVYYGNIWIWDNEPFIHIKKKRMLIKSSISSNMIHQPIDKVYQLLNQQPEWFIIDRKSHDHAGLSSNNAILAKGQAIQLLNTSYGSISTNLIIETKQAVAAKERLKGNLDFIYGTLFEGENYELNGTERLLMLEEGQTVTLGQPVRGHLDFYGSKKHIEALPSGTQFMLCVAGQAIAQGRVV